MQIANQHHPYGAHRMGPDDTEVTRRMYRGEKSVFDIMAEYTALPDEQKSVIAKIVGRAASGQGKIKLEETDFEQLLKVYPNAAAFDSEVPEMIMNTIKHQPEKIEKYQNGLQLAKQLMYGNT